jgi:hypothetical protein
MRSSALAALSVCFLVAHAIGGIAGLLVSVSVFVPVFILVVLGTYTSSMRTSPPVWIDEVMIVEYGRVMLDEGLGFEALWERAEARAGKR